MKPLFVLLSRDETIGALRANVAKLQTKLNRTNVYVSRLEAQNRRLKEQIRGDRAYVDAAKEALREIAASDGEGATLARETLGFLHGQKGLRVGRYTTDVGPDVDESDLDTTEAT